MNTFGKPLSSIALLALFLCLAPIPAYAGYVPGEILVKFRAGAESSGIDTLNVNRAAVTKRRFRQVNIHQIKLPRNMSVEEAVAYYSGDPSVEYAEPNYIVHAAAAPNDPSFGSLWGLHNTGQTVNTVSGSADADIDAPEAWDVETGSSNSIVIAVVDTGIAYNHPDLNANIWTNTGETNCSDSVDNDGNGYIDDCKGWDFADDDNDPMDYNGHGSHVAGTIAAAGNNNAGITGVMWQAELMPVRFLGADGFGATSDAIEAILYASANGAHVINNSWGGSGFSNALKDAIDASGIPVVCAAGNDGIDNDSVLSPFYPASFTSDNILAVAATDQNDSLASFSNFGLASVDLAAPGTNMYSTVPAKELDDNFDDGDISNWTTGGTPDTWAVSTDEKTSGTYSLADSPGSNYGNNANSWAQTPVIDLSGKDGCMLTYELKLETLSGDVLYIEASTDGTSWTALPNSYSGTTGGGFVKLIEDLTGYDGEASLYVRYRLQTNASGTDEGAYVDDVEIICASSSSEDYEYYQGTSMATPHVAGVAGLLMAENTALAYNQVKAIILNNVDAVGSLAAWVLTGGRLNAFGAIQDAAAPNIPTNLDAGDVSSAEIALTWTDNSSDETGYKVERKTGSTGTYAEIASAGVNAVSYSDTNVSAGTTYYYRVLVVGGSSGTYSYSNEARATIPAVSSGGGGGGGGGGCFIETSAAESVVRTYMEQIRDFTVRHFFHSSQKR